MKTTLTPDPDRPSDSPSDNPSDNPLDNPLGEPEVLLTDRGSRLGDDSRVGSTA